MKKKVLYVALMMGTTLLTGCLGDDNKKNDPIDVTITEGVVVVNNGSSYNGIDGSMSFIDLRNDAIQQNVYKTANGASLGGTPNDAIVYGQKLYVVGSDENTVFVLNPKTFKEITKISTTDILGAEGGVNPRHLTAYDGKVYVSTYGNYVTTIDGKMNYLEAVKDTGYVYGEAEVQRQGGRIGVYTVKLMDENQRVLVTADFTYYRTGQAIDQQG